MCYTTGGGCHIGIKFTQTEGISYFFKPTLDTSDAQNGQGYYVSLANDLTSEKDWPSNTNWTTCLSGVVIGLALASEPSANVMVTLWIGTSADQGGDARVEGVISGVYEVARTNVQATAPWIGEQYEDYVKLTTMDNTYTLHWHTANYTAVQYIRICGLDDFYDDDDSEYHIYGNVSSHDSLYGVMNTGDKSSDFALVLHNEDDDEALVEVVADTDRCSEAVEDKVITLTYRVNSKPKSTVLLDFSSSFPTEATASPARVAVTDRNWMYNDTVTVSSIDDYVNDGNQVFKLTVGVLVTEDPQYWALDEIVFEFVSEDDPDDEDSVSTTGMDVFVANISTSDPGSPYTKSYAIQNVLHGRSMTSEEGYQVYYDITLTFPPQATVTFELVTTRADEATVDPNVLFFTADNYNETQRVAVTGISDSDNDDHQYYSLKILPPATEDPYYAHVLTDAVALPLINRASFLSRLYIHVEKLDMDCEPVERGGMCLVQITLLQLADDEYVEPSDYLDLFEDDVASVVVSLIITDPDDLSFVVADNTTQQLMDTGLQVTFGYNSQLSGNAFTYNISVKAVADGAVDGNNLVNMSVTASLVYEDVTHTIPTSHLEYTELMFTTYDTDNTFFYADTTNCTGDDNQLQELSDRQCSVQLSLAFEPSDNVEITVVVDDPSRAAVVSVNGIATTSGSSTRRLLSSGASSATLTFSPESYDTPQKLVLVGLDDNVWNGDLYTGVASPIVFRVSEVSTDDASYADGAVGFTFNVSSDDNEAYGKWLLGLGMRPVAYTHFE